jgi:DNA repair photolyase
MDAVKELNDHGVKCTVRIDPVIPFLTDNHEDLKKIVFEAGGSGVEHITGGVLRSYGKSSILRVVKATPHVGEKLKRLYFEEGVLYGAEYFTPEPVRYRLMKTLRDLCD